MIKLYLFHSGIKGQRWGVRRYQNPDGTLTDLGKKRYGNSNEHGNSIVNQTGKKQLEADYRKADADAAKAILEGTSKSINTLDTAIGNVGKNKSKIVNNADYSKLSDAEIRQRINRLSMERSYGELTGDTKRIRSGADWTREILQTVGAAVAIGASIAITVGEINKIKLGNKGGK